MDYAWHEVDNPDCIHSVDEAIKYIMNLAFALFKNEIDGFSLEERTVPEYWWSDNPEIDPWMWRAIIARRHDIVYGKFFDKKAGLYQKSGFLYLLIIAGMDMILMHYMMMEKRLISIKR
mgnify:CR=1 FL=1